MSRPTLRLNDAFQHTLPGLRADVRELQGLPNEHGTVPETTRARGDPAMMAQLVELEKYRDHILEGAAHAGVRSSLVCGIGSRESHWGLILDPPGPAGTGDRVRRPTPRPWRPGDLPPDGGGFGRGLMQIDYDAHAFARGEEWRDARKNIFYGCEVLRQDLTLLKRKAGLDGPALLRAAVAGYNCGAGNVLRALADGRDIDYFTHGRDYSRNTLDRAVWFQLQGWD